MALIGHIMGVVGAPGEVHTSQKNTLGTRAFDSNGYEYIYLQGVGSTVDGSWVTWDDDFATALVDSGAATTLKGPVALATAAVDATTEYGWYLIDGVKTTAKAISGGAAADNAILYATSTAGVVDDVAVANNQIVGAVSRSAEGAVTAGDIKVQINHPWIGVDESAA